MSEVEKFFKTMNQFLILVGCLYALFVVLSLFGLTYDSTDKNTWYGHKRSGLSIHTDELTGCQYLRRDGLTPRLDSNGNHICEVTP